MQSEMMKQYVVPGIADMPHVTAALAKEGIESPTGIQLQAMPLVLTQRHVAIRSGTGTGKTLAYVLPLLQQAAANPPYRVVIVAPSPELAVQILRTVEAFKAPHVTCLGLIGSGNPQRQRDRLKKHPQVLVGTPGRLLDLILAKKIKTAQIKAFVLDEVDEILSEDNDKLLRGIFSRPECQPQIICVSATFGSKALRFMDTCMVDRAIADVEDAPQVTRIRHVRVPYNQQRKDVALLTLLHTHRIKRAMLFVNRLTHVGHVYRVLADAGLPVVTISGDRGKFDREHAMRAVRSEQPCILVATDAAARGLDVKALDWVIHYEMARDVPTYVHRSGRTARAGRRGHSLALVAPAEQHLVRMCEQALGIVFEVVSVREERRMSQRTGVE